MTRPTVGEAELEAVRRVFASGQLVQGREVAGLEAEVEALLGGRVRAVAVSSGGAALFLALRAAGVGPLDEVIVPAYTFPAAAQAAVLLGARPVPADVDPETLAPGVKEVSARLSERTRAVVVAHAFGVPAPVEGVLAWCRAEGVAFVEDAACALGGVLEGGQPAGTVGDFGCFSLHGRKLATCGEGGLVVCARPSDWERLRAFRDYGRTGRGFGDVFSEVGLNFRLSEVAAAIGRVQVGRLSAHLCELRAVARMYLEALVGVGGIEVPGGARSLEATYQTFVVLVDDGARVVARLREEGVEASPGAHALTEQSFYVRRFGAGPDCPVARSLARRLVALPIYEGMGEEEVGRVVGALKEAVSRG